MRAHPPRWRSFSVTRKFPSLEGDRLPRLFYVNCCPTVIEWPKNGTVTKLRLEVSQSFVELSPRPQTREEKKGSLVLFVLVTQKGSSRLGKSVAG